MRINTSENIIHVDVDDTLVFDQDKVTEESITVDYYGTPRLVRPHQKHVEFVKSLSIRGYYIKVHSHNGWAWAENVIIALGLEEYVDEVESKGIYYIDDKDVSLWYGPRVYIKEKEQK